MHSFMVDFDIEFVTGTFLNASRGRHLFTLFGFINNKSAIVK